MMDDDGRGRIAGRYRLTSVVNAGGSGTVWAAVDEVLGREVAVKEITASQYESEPDSAPVTEHTMREARAAGRVDHPGVVHVYDVVEHDGRPWIVMQLVKAPSLAEVIGRDGPRTPHEVAKLGLQLVGALRAAHALGIIHCDVKPSNVLVKGDRAVLTDFGIAHIEGEAPPFSKDTLAGAPSYIAPECVRGAPPTPASDLWALGATLYTAVEGRPPFHQDSPVATLTAVATGEPDPVRWAGMLAPLLTKLLARDPQRRADSAQIECELTRLVALGDTADARPAPTGEPIGDETTTSDFRSLQSVEAQRPEPGSSSDRAGRIRRRAIAVAAAIVLLAALILGMLVPSRAAVEASLSPVVGQRPDAAAAAEPDPAGNQPSVVPNGPATLVRAEPAVQPEPAVQLEPAARPRPAANANPHPAPQANTQGHAEPAAQANPVAQIGPAVHPVPAGPSRVGLERRPGNK